jgi:hypothetical protein
MGDMPTILALVLGAVALVVAIIFPWSFLAKASAAAGALLALIGLGLARRNMVRVALAAFAIVVCAVDLQFMIRWSTVPARPTGLFAIPLQPGRHEFPHPAQPDAWFDAAKYALYEHGFRVQILTTRFLGPEVLRKDRQDQLPGKILMIQLLLAYDGKPTGGDYESWADQAAVSKHRPELTDSAGRTYSQLLLDIEGLPKQVRDVAGPSAPLRTGPATRLAPGQRLSEILFFEGPSADASVLRLQLPLSAFGMTGAFRFQIPNTMFRDR